MPDSGGSAIRVARCIRRCRFSVAVRVRKVIFPHRESGFNPENHIAVINGQSWSWTSSLREARMGSTVRVCECVRAAAVRGEPFIDGVRSGGEVPFAIRRRRHGHDMAGWLAAKE